MSYQPKRGRVATAGELAELARLRAAVLEDIREGRALSAWMLREQARQMKDARRRIMREMLQAPDTRQARID